MEKLEKNNIEKILKKVTSVPIMGYISLIVSILGIGLLIFGIIDIHNNYASIFYIIFGIIFSFFFFIYLFQRHKVKSNIKNIDIEKVKYEMIEGTINDSLYKTYFTKNYIISYFYCGFIVDFKDILWIYKKKLADLDYDPVKGYDLVICDKYGRKHSVPYSDLLFNTIVERNKKVLIGLEHRNEYNKMIKEISDYH